jgi:hypothetical protein
MSKILDAIIKPDKKPKYKKYPERMPVVRDPVLKCEDLNPCQIAFLSGLLACGKADQEISEVLKVDARVINNYRRLYASGQLDQLVADRISQIKINMPSQILGIIQLGLNILTDPEKLESLPADKLAITIGILIDKYRLLTNQSTSNISIISRVQAMIDPRDTVDD